MSRSLLKRGSEKWLPTSITTLEGILQQRLHGGAGIPNVACIRKNIAYNLQYLEFLEETIKTIDLTSVLVTQTYKVYIITAVSIIEALFYCLLKEKGYHTTTDWLAEKTQVGVEHEIGGVKYRVENTLLRKLPRPMDLEMKFETMRQKVEQKKLLGRTFTAYPDIKRFQRLRNRVHIHVVGHDGNDTDYFNFNRTDYQEARKVLWKVVEAMFTLGAEEQEALDFLHA